MLRSQGNRLVNYPESSLLILQLHKMLWSHLKDQSSLMRLLCIYDFNLFNITGVFILDVLDFCPSVWPRYYDTIEYGPLRTQWAHQRLTRPTINAAHFTVWRPVVLLLFRITLFTLEEGRGTALLAQDKAFVEWSEGVRSDSVARVSHSVRESSHSSLVTNIGVSMFN